MDADEIFFKEVFQKERIPEADRLDVCKIKEELVSNGKVVTIFDDFREIKYFLEALDFNRENVVVILSNGSFGDIPNFIKRLGA
jgi:UDP-N-acetylmuramate-alanine ligase